MEYYIGSITSLKAALTLLKEAFIDWMNTTTLQYINVLDVKDAVNGDVLEVSLIYKVSWD